MASSCLLSELVLYDNESETTNYILRINNFRLYEAQPFLALSIFSEPEHIATLSK